VPVHLTSLVWQFSRHTFESLSGVIAKAVGLGLEHGEGRDVGLLLRGIHTTWSERHPHLNTSPFVAPDGGAHRWHHRVHSRIKHYTSATG
jgi:hypothetical protein